MLAASLWLQWRLGCKQRFKAVFSCRRLCWRSSGGTLLRPASGRSSRLWPAGVGRMAMGRPHRKWCQRCVCRSWRWPRCWPWCVRLVWLVPMISWTPSRRARKNETWTWTTAACWVKHYSSDSQSPGRGFQFIPALAELSSMPFRSLCVCYMKLFQLLLCRSEWSSWWVLLVSIMTTDTYL